jgi:hypothetical protein
LAIEKSAGWSRTFCTPIELPTPEKEDGLTREIKHYLEALLDGSLKQLQIANEISKLIPVPLYIILSQPPTNLGVLLIKYELFQ